MRKDWASSLAIYRRHSRELIEDWFDDFSSQQTSTVSGAHSPGIESLGELHRGSAPRIPKPEETKCLLVAVKFESVSTW